MITGAVDFVTGNYIVFDFDKLDRDEKPKAILASASVPGAFPVTKIRDWHLMDGGTVWNLNIVSPSGIGSPQILHFAVSLISLSFR
jgi:predicted acylesterase/phospholipase RssA